MDDIGLHLDYIGLHWIILIEYITLYRITFGLHWTTFGSHLDDIGLHLDDTGLQVDCIWMTLLGLRF